MGYSIKILSNKEFDNLPYSKVRTSLGVADPETDTAYIRQTGIQKLNEYLINHEFDHLVEEIPTDEFDGVRYKDMSGFLGGLGKTASAAAPFVAMVNPALGAGLQLGGGLTSGGGRGFLSSIPSAIGNFFGGGNAYASQASAPNTFSGITSSGKGFNVGSGSGFGSFGPTGRGGGGNSWMPSSALNNNGGFLNSIFNGIGNILGNLQKTASNPQFQLGTGLLGLGLGKSLPQVPPLPESVNQLRSTVQAGGSPLRQQATGQLSSLMNQQFQPLSDPEIQAATRQLELDQQKAVMGVHDLYRNLRPGTDPSTDSSFQRDLGLVNDQYSRAKADLLANRTRDLQTTFNTQRMQQIQQALGADDQTMQQLAQLAQLDIQQIMAQLQIDYASAQQFKSTFANLGGQMILSGTGSASPFDIFKAGGTT